MNVWLIWLMSGFNLWFYVWLIWFISGSIGIDMEVSIVMGGPKNGWFVVEDPCSNG